MTGLHDPMSVDDATEVYIAAHTLLTISATLLPPGEQQLMIPAIWPLRTVGLSGAEYRTIGRDAMVVLDAIVVRSERTSELRWWARLASALLYRILMLDQPSHPTVRTASLQDIAWLLDQRPIPFDSLFLGFWDLMCAGTGAATAGELTGLTLPGPAEGP